MAVLDNLKRWFTPPAWLRKAALAGVSEALLDWIGKLDSLQPKIKQLILEHGPEAADHIVDLIQEKLGALVKSLLPK